MTKRHLYKEKQTFSLRKYSFGVASVLLAASVMLSPKALAEEQANNTASTQKVAEVSAVSQSEMKEATTNELVLQTSDDTKIVTNQAESVSASTSPISTTSNTEVATENTVEASEDISSDSLAPKVTSEENNQADSAVQDLSQQEQAPETVALESPTVESYQGRAASAGDSLEPSGTYTFTERTEVKNTPRVSAPTEFYMTAGQKVNYDQVVNADGYEWISYKSYSGIRRYAPVLEAISIPEDTSSDSPKEPVALDIPEQGRYTFTRNTEIKTVPKVSEAPTFIFSKGDSVYYDKSLVADGHQWISYISYSGARYYADIANLTETNPSQETPDKRQDLAPKGRYLFTKESVVKNEPKRSAPTEFVFVKGESVYYDKVLEADGRQWISYISYNGMRRYVDIAVSQQTQNQQPTGHLNVQHNSNGDFTVLVSNVADSNGIKAVKVPVWTSKNDQDEIIWYDGVKQTDGSYKVDVKRANHNNEYGEYNIHLYYVENSGKMVGVTTTKTVTKPQAQVTGSLNVTQKANGDFTVLVSNVADSNGIKAVKVPVWTSK
ncbi:SH3 domain-containing protein, partial [Streptococcus sp. zg-JUN1979]|uniref:SH3 domain-containing protein n=1 Tax=Streptococcus sp. zg-JUN1979 TaxID=3391450 RepID=UPI0039A47D4D